MVKVKDVSTRPSPKVRPGSSNLIISRPAPHQFEWKGDESRGIPIAALHDVGGCATSLHGVGNTTATSTLRAVDGCGSKSRQKQDQKETNNKKKMEEDEEEGTAEKGGEEYENTSQVTNQCSTSPWSAS